MLFSVSKEKKWPLPSITASRERIDAHLVTNSSPVSSSGQQPRRVLGPQLGNEVVGVPRVWLFQLARFGQRMHKTW